MACQEAGDLAVAELRCIVLLSMKGREENVLRIWAVASGFFT
jgi:hypothetical protein